MEINWTLPAQQVSWCYFCLMTKSSDSLEGKQIKMFYQHKRVCEAVQ